MTEHTRARIIQCIIEFMLLWFGAVITYDGGFRDPVWLGLATLWMGIVGAIIIIEII